TNAIYTADQYVTAGKLTLPGHAIFKLLEPNFVAQPAASNQLNALFWFEATVTRVSDRCTLKTFPLKPGLRYYAVDRRLEDVPNPVSHVDYSSAYFKSLPTEPELRQFSLAPHHAGRKGETPLRLQNPWHWEMAAVIAVGAAGLAVLIGAV